MTKEEVIQLLVLIESVYSNFIVKDDTILYWFEFCSEMDFEKVMAKVKTHIRKSPFPPSIADIAVFNHEQSDFQETLQKWMKKGRDRIVCDSKSNKRTPLPAWLDEFSPRKSV